MITNSPLLCMSFNSFALFACFHLHSSVYIEFTLNHSFTHLFDELSPRSHWKCKHEIVFKTSRSTLQISFILFAMHNSRLFSANVSRTVSQRASQPANITFGEKTTTKDKLSKIKFWH